MPKGKRQGTRSIRFGDVLEDVFAE
jgi:hypothetical protein